MNYVLWIYIWSGSIGISQSTIMFKSKEACENAAVIISNRLGKGLFRLGSAVTECLTDGAK